MADTKKPNSTQIAKLAGISRSTVSRVINGYSNVPEKTRKLVMDTIEKYGYYPSLSGQVLRGKRTKCLGLFWGSYGTISYDMLASSFLIHVIESAAAKGYLVLTCIPRSFSAEQNKRQIKEIFHQGRIDAGIFFGANDEEPLLDELEADGMMVGVFDQQNVSGKRFTVNFEADTGLKAIRYVSALGHKDIAILDGDLHRHSSFLRHESYLKGMLEAGLPIRPEWMHIGDSGAALTRDGGETVMRELLQSNATYPTVVCCNNDATALGAYRAIADAGLKVGEDISVIGVDDHHLSSLVTPALTTFRFDFCRMCTSLVNRMIDALEGETDVPRDEVFTSELVERASCRPAK